MTYNTKAPLEVAIVGSGPSGFYVAEALLNSGIPVKIVMLEKLPSPFGLIRYGIAPDKQRLKEITLTYEYIARHPAVTFMGNVNVGSDISMNELLQACHAVVFTCGMSSNASLGIPGENLQGVHSASEFIGWLNGHPHAQEQVFNFDKEDAVIVGHGNVALDITRIMSKSVDDLRYTDITDNAIEALSKSRIKHIHIVGRRGPMQAKFTANELHALGQLDSGIPSVSSGDLLLNAESQLEFDVSPSLENRRNYNILKQFSSKGRKKGNKISIDFFLNPIELKGEKSLEKAVFHRTMLSGEPFCQIAQNSDVTADINCGILFKSTGFRGLKIPGVPFEESTGTYAHTNSRIILPSCKKYLGLYTAGWVKRGSKGTMGISQVDAVETVSSLLADVSALKAKSVAGINDLISSLRLRKVRAVSFKDWEVINAQEISRGKKKGKPREKFTSVDDMLSCL